MDLLETGSAWLEEQRNAFLTRPIVYTRAEASVSVQATVGKTVFNVDKGFGFMERTEARDYLVNTADLILADAVALPLPGDRISETQGTKVFTYEVMAPGNEPAYRYSDLYRKTLRIHTKLIGIEDAP